MPSAPPTTYESCFVVISVLSGDTRRQGALLAVKQVVLLAHSLCRDNKSRANRPGCMTTRKRHKHELLKSPSSPS